MAITPSKPGIFLSQPVSQNIPVHRLDNAIDYALDEKKSSRAENRESLEGEIDKALNKDQSEQDLFQSAIGCTIDSAFEDMCQIKKIWHKEKGVQGFHLVQSFAPGEISPELAHQIGVEFADRLFGGKFQAVVSTHLNTKCIHNHIVWNSVSMENGKKYRSNEKNYVTGVWKISDELCVKHLFCNYVINMFVKSLCYVHIGNFCAKIFREIDRSVYLIL